MIRKKSLNTCTYHNVLKKEKKKKKEINIYMKPLGYIYSGGFNLHLNDKLLIYIYREFMSFVI